MRNSIDQADVVIVGGGLVGTSAAWHLARAGITDVLLLERNELASGASARAAGLLNHTRPDPGTIRMICRTREAISELENTLGEPIGFRQHGCVRAVFSELREREMLAMEAVMRAAGLQVREIDRYEARERVPWLTVDDARRTIFVPEDGYADGARLCSAYARAAREAGVRIRRGVDVTGLVHEDGEVDGVMTSDGCVRSHWVVCAAGAWEIALAASIGFGFAGAPTRSHYWITAPDGSGAPGQPNVYLPDMRAYLRPEVGGLLIGLQEASTQTWHPMQLERDMSDMNLTSGGDLDLLYEQASVLRPVIPRIDEWGFAHHVAGLSVYTPDGKFVVGQPAGTSGLIVAGGCCGSGLAASGGFGEVIASIVSGDATDIDASLYDPNRFGRVDPASDEFRDRCAAARAGKSRGNLSLN